MRYRVVARYVDDHVIVDQAVVDEYIEAVDLCVNWQSYYDDCEQWDDKEVVVFIENYYEEGDVFHA